MTVIRTIRKNIYYYLYCYRLNGYVFGYLFFSREVFFSLDTRISLNLGRTLVEPQLKSSDLNARHRLRNTRQLMLFMDRM